MSEEVFAATEVFGSTLVLAVLNVGWRLSEFHSPRRSQRCYYPLVQS